MGRQLRASLRVGSGSGSGSGEGEESAAADALGCVDSQLSHRRPGHLLLCFMSSHLPLDL